jgi:hypothetical protein
VLYELEKEVLIGTCLHAGIQEQSVSPYHVGDIERIGGYVHIEIVIGYGSSQAGGLLEGLGACLCQTPIEELRRHFTVIPAQDYAPFSYRPGFPWKPCYLPVLNSGIDIRA